MTVKVCTGCVKAREVPYTHTQHTTIHLAGRGLPLRNDLTENDQ